MAEDSTLLQRFAREGDQAAFAELVTRHIDRVYAVALRQVGGDTHLAEDVAQVVFTTLARKAAALIDHPALSAWIHRTTHHAAIDTVRTEVRRRAREEKAQLMHSLHNNPVRDAAWEKLRPDLDAIMAGLPERDRTALALRFFEDRAFAEIGRRLSLSEDAARMRVDRALEKMRTRLAHRGITCTAAALGGVLAAPGLVAAPSGLAATIATTALSASTATAVGVGTGAFVTLMSSTKFVTGLAATIVVLAVGTATLDSVSVDPAHTTVVPERTEIANLEEIRALDVKVAAVAAETEAMRREVASLRTARAEATARLMVPQRTDSSTAEQLGYAFMERHPEVRQALFEWKDAQTRFEYGALFRKLALTPAQIDEFLAIKRANGNVSGTWGPNDALMTLRVQTTDSPSSPETRLPDLLGAEGFKAYREYERTRAERRMSLRAASYACFTDEPLSVEQTDELTRVLRDNRLRQSPGNGPERYAWDKVFADAAGILTPAQSRVLEALRADDRYSAALNRTMPVGPTP